MYGQRTTNCCVVSIWVGVISHSQSHQNHSITAEGSKCFFPRQDEGRRLVYTKSIFTLQDQSPALLPRPRSFLFKQQSPRWCSEPISPGQHGTFHLGSIGWCKLSLGFSIHNFMVLEVTAERADFFFPFRCIKKKKPSGCCKMPLSSVRCQPQMSCK